MNPISNQFTSIEQVTNQFLNKKDVKNFDNTADVSFEDILKGKQELKFSKHASNRLLERNISLTDEQSMRLQSGVKVAEMKGINESLVLVDSLAFIVNVPNNTVVTAIDQNKTKENVFTNIDGAVIM